MFVTHTLHHTSQYTQHTHTRTQTQAHAHRHTQTHTHRHIDTHARTHARTHAHYILSRNYTTPLTDKHRLTHTHTYTYKHACTRTDARDTYTCTYVPKLFCLLLLLTRHESQEMLSHIKRHHLGWTATQRSLQNGERKFACVQGNKVTKYS